MGDDALKMALNEAMTGRFLHQLPSPPKKNTLSDRISINVRCHLTGVKNL